MASSTQERLANQDLPLAVMRSNAHWKRPLLALPLMARLMLVLVQLPMMSQLMAFLASAHLPELAGSSGARAAICSKSVDGTVRACASIAHGQIKLVGEKVQWFRTQGSQAHLLHY